MGVEILARTSNNVKPTNENETINHTSLAGIRNMYWTQAIQPICAGVRETKQFRPLAKNNRYAFKIQMINLQVCTIHVCSR